MASIWIIHRDERLRAALARLAAAADDDALDAAPDDVSLDDAAAPRLIVLGLAGDLESELDFAHRQSARMRGVRWLLVCEARDRDDVERLFASLGAEVLTFPPTAAELRARIRSALAPRELAALSERRLRDALAARYARWFADLDLPALRRALEPAMAGVALLVRGEPGTGRALLARYAHHFGPGSGAGGRWVELACAGGPAPGALRESLAGATGAPPGPARSLTICLTDVDRLPAASQHELRGWIELAPPTGAPPGARVRWMATAGDDAPLGRTPGLDAALEQALAGLSLRIPPLRERPGAIAPFAADMALAWSRERGESPRRFAPDALAALGEHPWPGNLRELEAVLVRTLAAERGDPIRASALRFEPAAFAAPAFAAPAEPAPAEPAAPEPRAPALEPPAARAAPAVDPGEEVRRLARSLAHEVRNPLVAIRTFSELLPERAEDPAFRREFSRVVGQDVQRIERVVERLGRYGELSRGDAGPVDVAQLLEDQLEAVRDQIEERRLLVLKELDHAHPEVRADRGALALAFELVLAKALEWMPDRADVYLASRHQPTGLRGGPSVRVVLRFYRPGAGAVAEPLDEAHAALSARETSLEFSIAELLIRAQAGRLALDATDADETVVVVDLPAAQA